MTEGTQGNQRLALLLSMAMFVLVVDTSLMNVSIASVVDDLDTTVSGVQSAIALEALVSAAFILIGSKVGDLFGRKRAYVLGLLGYAVGALAMALAQSLTAIIVFWAVIGGLGASLLLPAMQSLIHGNFEGAAQKKAYALVGAAAAIAAAVGPLLGGFITTYLSWRIAFLLEVVVIAIVLANIRLVHDVPYTGPRRIDLGGAALSVVGMGGIVLGILLWQEGGEAVGAVLAIGAVALVAFFFWLRRRKREAKPTLIDPALFDSKVFRFGITQQMLQQIALGGTMIALPIYLQMVLEYSAMEAGLSLAPLSLTMFGTAILAGKKSGSRRPSSIIRVGVRDVDGRTVLLLPIVPRADSGWWLLVPLVIAGVGLGLLVSQLNNYTLSPISEERVSEAAGVNSAAGSFGLSFGLAFAGAILLAALSIAFTDMAENSAVLSPAEQQRVSQALEDDAEVMSNTALEELLVGEPEATQAEIIRINTDARPIRAPGRPADPDPRRPPRPAELVPHDAHPGPGAIERRRRARLGLAGAARRVEEGRWGVRGTRRPRRAHRAGARRSVLQLPEALPRGRHKLSREQVSDAQRERMLAAVTELLPAHGYRGFGVGDVAGRAGVSLGTFYRCFESKDGCVFAGYDRFIEVLLTRMAAVDIPDDDRPALTAGLIGAYLDTLQQDLVVARAYQVEIDALGPEARARRRDALNLFATYIRERVERSTGSAELPWTAYIGIVYAARRLASDALDTAAAPDLSLLGSDLEIWLSDLFRTR